LFFSDIVAVFDTATLRVFCLIFAGNVGHHAKSAVNGGRRRGFFAVFPAIVRQRPNQRRDPADKRPSRQQIQSQNRAPISFSAGNGHNGGKKIGDDYRDQNKKKEKRQIVHNFDMLIDFDFALCHFITF